MLISFILVCVLICILVLVVHFYNKEFAPQFYKTSPSKIESQYQEWTLDGANTTNTKQCLVWDNDTKGMYYQECDDTKDNQKFSMFYMDKEKTKPHGFGVMEKGGYQCFGPSKDNVTIQKTECDTENLYQKFIYDNDGQRLEYMGPNVKSTSSLVMVPQSYQTNNKVIIWDTFTNDLKGNQVFN
jgi:hypothetical protein